MTAVPSRVGSGQVADLAASLVGRGHGRARAVVLTGAPGIGKSTTLEALGRRLSDDGVDVRRVNADNPERARPFGVVTDLLGLDPVSPPRPDSADGLVAEVERLCRAAPVALCVDDAHRSDPDSLDALVRLLDLTHDLPLVLVLARRTVPERPGLTALTRKPRVVVVEVTGLTDDGVDGLVRARSGVPPSSGLRALLSGADTNPLRIRAVLDDLERRELVRVRQRELVLLTGHHATSASIEAGVRAQLELLEPPASELAALLAAWGGRADVATLAELTGTGPTTVLRPVQLGVEAGVLRWRPPDEVEFVHDLHRDLLMADLPAPIAHALHAACAGVMRRRGAQLPALARQTARAGALDAVASLRAAAADLAHAPLEAAELLAEAAAHVTAGSVEGDELAVQRAGALAVAGRVEAAEQVAREGLVRSRDPATHADLRSVVLFCLVSAARVDDALAEIDALSPRASTPEARAALAGVRRWVTLLGGRTVVADPSRAVATSASGLICDATELFLAADAEGALERATAAVRARSSDRSRPWTDSPTTPVWPAFFALHAEGPVRAEQLSLDARRVAQQNGQLWLTPFHLSASAGIHFQAGSWDDALAEVESALEAAEATGTGWTSMTVATRLQILVRRGELAAADGLVESWRATARPEQFGLPHVTQGRALLLEAREETGRAAALIRDTWIRAADGGRVIWPLLAGPDAVRVAREAGDDDLVARIARDTAAVPLTRVRGAAPAARVVAAVAGGGAGEAAAAALDYRSLGHVTGELTSWEEAACLAAAAGDVDQARAAAARCGSLASALGAVTVERRLAARLRRFGLRQGVRGSRRRPERGWESLTRTELQVADLVGHGLTSPQVAARLYISPRTVQTHISHILRKLDLRSRVELAGELARRGGARPLPRAAPD